MKQLFSHPFWARLLFAFLLVVAASFAQGQTFVRWDLGTPGSAGATTTQGAGLPFLVAVPGVQLNWCSSPANGVPCTNFAPTYTSISGATSCPINAQIVLQNSTTCSGTGDNLGNLGVYTIAGTYSYTLTANGVNSGPFIVTVGGSGGGGGNVNLASPGPIGYVTPGSIAVTTLSTTGPATFGTPTSPAIAALLFNGPDPFGLCNNLGFDQLTDVTDPATGFSALAFDYNCLVNHKLFMTAFQSVPYADGNFYGYNATVGDWEVVPNAGFNSQTGAATFNGGVTSNSYTGTGSGTNVLSNLTLSNATLGQPTTTNVNLAVTSTPVVLFADQFTGADWCAKVNAAITALPSTGGTVDARGFTVAQACNSNPYHGQPKNVRLLLPAVPIVTSVPWWTPSNANILEGVADGDSSSALGSVIQACGPTATGWNGSLCVVNGDNVPQFPNSTTVLTFNIPHGPFPAGTYSCIICGGGQGSSEGLGWQNNSFGQIVQHLKIDGGSNTNVFGYYTENAQERSIIDDINCGNFGGSNLNPNVACGMWDRTEAPSSQSGPSHFKIGNVHVNFNNTGGNSTSSWGFVIELNSATCVLSGGGGTGATCYVQKVNSGIPLVAVGYPGGVAGGGTNYTSAPTWTVYGAPATYGGGLINGCTGTTVLTSNQVSGMGSQCGTNGYQVGQFAEGPESFTGTVQGNSSNNIAGGLYLASENPGIDYLHCERMATCIQFGNGGDLSSGGLIKNIDTTSTLTGNLIHYEPGSDGQTNLWSGQFTSVGGSPNLISDDCPVSGIVGSNISIPVSNTPLFGSVRSMEFYSGCGILNFFDTLKFGPGLGAINHILGPTDQALTFSAASTTGSNQLGLDAVLQSGLGSGNATAAHTKLKGASQSFTSGSTAQNQVTEWVQHKKLGSTTNTTATNLFNVALATGQTGAFEIVVNVSAFQGTPHECSTTEVFIAAIQDTSGTVTQQTTAGTLATICDTGTLTLAASFSTAAPSVFSVTPTWGTIVPAGVVITVEIHNLSQQEISLL